MNILITGAGGMLGGKLVAKLLAERAIAHRSITSMTLTDVGGLSDPPPSGRVQTVVADVSQPGVATSLLESRPELIFHLAAVVSGEAEADFEKGYRVNLDGTRALLEAIRKIGGRYCPRFVFASSVAVFGSPLPEVIDDDQVLTPLTSYGTQKAICELLLADYSRRGCIDGVGIRLPTIAIRPGKPNKAASGFFSNILREPLAGAEAILPVDESVRHWFASPRSAVGFLVHAATLDTSKLGSHRSLNLPGLSATVGEQLEALKRVAGERAATLVKRVPDPQIIKMIGSWPRSFNARRARELGFVAESSFDEIIRVHIEDELGGVLSV